MKSIPQIHQWTNGGERVLIVKVLNRDGTTHKGFIWPQTIGAIVKPVNFSREPSCASGGLFGWAWGLLIGDGKDPDACATWLVFSALPKNVIQVDVKCKVVPDEKDENECARIEYIGSQAGAMSFTMAGRLAWIEARSSGSASATGYSGSASATGDSGSASATGDSGSASATGYRGSASATGDSGSASATGDNCIGISTGIDSAASASIGNWIVVSEWKEKDGKWQRICVKNAKIDGKKLKADTPYKLVNGEFKETLS